MPNQINMTKKGKGGKGPASIIQRNSIMLVNVLNV